MLLALAQPVCDAPGHVRSPIVPTLAAGPFQLRPFTRDIDAVREASNIPHPITTVPAAFTEDGGRLIERRYAERGTGYCSLLPTPVPIARSVRSGWLKDDDGRASVGYWVVRRGAAGYAARALARWAHQELQVPRLELYVEPWNTASIRTAENAGYQREGLLRSWQEVGGTRRDMYMYARLATDPAPPAS